MPIKTPTLTYETALESEHCSFVTKVAYGWMTASLCRGHRKVEKPGHSPEGPSNRTAHNDVTAA